MPSRLRSALVALLAAMVVALVLLPIAFSGRPAVPAEGSADVGFARDMGIHHAQAVEMSFIVLAKRPAPEVRVLATDIINTQSTQRGMMMGWLDLWGLPQTSTRPPMAWASGHGAHAAVVAAGGRMTGLASRAEMGGLRAASGVEAEVQFLTLMILHHRGGVAMAEAAVAGARSPLVRRLAQTMINGQTKEIGAMNEMLSRRGAAPA